MNTWLGRARGPHGRGQAGATLLELMMSVVVLGMLGVMLLQITMTTTSRSSDSSTNRSLDASTAQFVALRFGRDVQGSAGVSATPCGSTGGATVLVTTVASELGRLTTYRAVPNGSRFDLVRTACSAGGSVVDTATLARELAAEPTVTCSPSACSPSTPPSRITLRVARSATFGFDVAGDRRAAVASGVPSVLPAPLFALGGSTPLDISGNGHLQVVGNALVNSSSPKAVSLSGANARLTISGRFAILAGGVCFKCTAVNVDPDPPVGSFPVALPDPLKYLPVPTEAGLTLFSCSTSTCPNLGPGVYPKQLAVAGSTTFASGTYILRKGAAFSGSGTISGTGVLFVNGCAPDSPTSCASSGPGSFSVSGGAAVNLAPASSGTHAGILLQQPATNTQAISISGGATLQLFSGVLYAPESTGVSLGAGGGGLRLGAVVGKNLIVTGNGIVQVNGV